MNQDRAVFRPYAWLEKGCRGEPQGWHRHPTSGRRRPDGDEAQEHVRH